MATNFKITFAIRWDIEEADGGKCCICSSARFGKQTRMILIMDGKDKPQDHALCQSCGDHVPQKGKVKQRYKVCGVCGHRDALDVLKCDECGYDFPKQNARDLAPPP